MQGLQRVHVYRRAIAAVYRRSDSVGGRIDGSRQHYVAHGRWPDKSISRDKRNDSRLGDRSSLAHANMSLALRQQFTC